MNADLVYKALREEIVARINRETVYKALKYYGAPGLLDMEIKKNDEVIKMLGDYIRNHFEDKWEEYYKLNKSE